MKNLTKCLSTYLKIGMLASAVIFQTGCATQIEWAPRNPSWEEVNAQSRATNLAAQAQISEGRKKNPEFHKRLDRAISDEKIVITNSYDEKVYIGR